MKIHKYIKPYLFILLLGIIGTACSLSGESNTSNNTSPTQALNPGAVEKTIPGQLPHSLYFLSDQSGTFQVWRIEQDTVTQTQVTQAESAITQYVISKNGDLAYITNNQLYLLSANSAAPSILVDGGVINPNDPYQLYTQQIQGLVWSRDGILAYGQNGVNLYNPADQTHNKLNANQIVILDDGQYYPEYLFTPLSWSPDGKRVLTITGLSEGTSLAVIDISSAQITHFNEDYICCQTTWAADGQAAIVASPYLGITNSGLWTFNGTTGAKTTLLPTTTEDGTLNFAGWPHSLSTGEILLFYANTPSIPEQMPPLLMVKILPNESADPITIRPETWSVTDALWAPDGSSVIIIQPPLGESSNPNNGPILWINTHGSPPIPLSAGGNSPQWGP